MITRRVPKGVITVASLAASALAGVLLATDHCGLAAIATATASSAGTLEGRVGRRRGVPSLAGALLDASAHRYEEFFVLGGLAILFRTSATLLLLALVALVGSFMVSYGSAKADAYRVALPAGVMQGAQRGLLLSVGFALVPVVARVGESLEVPPWAERLPAIAAVALVGVLSNVSALRRLYAIAASRCPQQRPVTFPSAPRHERRILG
jgi:CDP-diacylglycerol--glycerol-3-phosphate 3-phosphatidyltransferase